MSKQIPKTIEEFKQSVNNCKCKSLCNNCNYRTAYIDGYNNGQANALNELKDLIIPLEEEIINIRETLELKE